MVDADAPPLAATHFGASARPRVRARAGRPGARARRRGRCAPSRSRRSPTPACVALGSADRREREPRTSPESWLVVHEGQPSRADLDLLVRDDLPHLLVTASEGRIEVGPFVVPGRTACLRCVDAHRAVADPRRSLVLEQVARAAGAGAVAPCDPLLWAWALGWAARDLARFAEGDRPSTWSTSFVLDARSAPREQVWSRHPYCGCAWQQAQQQAEHQTQQQTG